MLRSAEPSTFHSIKIQRVAFDDLKALADHYCRSLSGQITYLIKEEVARLSETDEADSGNHQKLAASAAGTYTEQNHLTRY